MANHASHAALPYPVKNARYTILIPYLDADGDPTDPTTPDTEVSKDDGAAADTAEEVASPKNSVGMLTLSGAETDCSCLSLAGKAASGPKTTLATLYPRVLPVIHSWSNADAGSSTSITLPSGASTIDDYYVGAIIKTTGGTGGGGTGGANNQARVITDYVGSTRVVTVAPAFETTPDNTTDGEILATELWLGRLANLVGISGAPVATGTAQLGVNVVNFGGSAGTFASGIPAVNATQFSGDTGAADNAEAFFDGTGYAGTNNVIPTVTNLTNAPPDSAGVTTLLSRIPAALFSGITSLAQWLGLIAGKQTGNATARTELRATGAGSGTFDETTDSQEALRDRGDAAWITATGFASAAQGTAIQAVTDKLDDTLEDDGGTYRFTVNALEQAPSGGGGGSTDWTADERTAIRSILGIPGSGTTPTDPSVGILDTIRDSVATKASQASVDDIPTNAELGTALAAADDAVLAQIALVKAATDNLPTDPADQSLIIAATNTISAAIAALNNLSAAGVRTELATELARLDVAVSTRLATAGYTAPPSAAAIATQVLASAASDPIASNLKEVNDVALQGAGTLADPWEPA